MLLRPSLCLRLLRCVCGILVLRLVCAGLFAMGHIGIQGRFQQSVQFASREGENDSSPTAVDDLTIQYDINDIQERKAPINFGQVIRQRMMRLVSKDKPPKHGIPADRRTRSMNTTRHRPLHDQPDPITTDYDRSTKEAWELRIHNAHQQQTRDTAGY